MNERILACTIFILSIVNINRAQEAPDTYFESSYGKLEYGFYIPESYDSTRTYPLIMYLHGMGNNYFVYLDWYNSDVQTENPCFVFTLPSGLCPVVCAVKIDCLLV